jgi:hypothetical protein
MKQYLFTSKALPGYTQANLAKINLELVTKLQKAAQVLIDAGKEDDIDLYYDLADLAKEEVYVKYCGRD